AAGRRDAGAGRETEGTVQRARVGGFGDVDLAVRVDRTLDLLAVLLWLRRRVRRARRPVGERPRRGRGRPARREWLQAQRVQGLPFAIDGEGVRADPGGDRRIGRGVGLDV